MKKIYIILIAVLICSTAIAQTKKADRLFDRWEYFRASKIYEKSAAKTANVDTYYKLGICHQKMNNYKDAMYAFDFVNAAGTYSNPEFYLNYGQVLKNNNKYEQAKIAFKKYNELVPNDPRGIFYYNSIDVVYDDRLTDLPVNISGVIAINTQNADFSPVFHNEGIVFTSNRKTSGHCKIYGWTGDHYLDLYYAKKGSDNKSFTEVAPFGGKKINKKYHDGPACFSKNGDTIYISRVEKYLQGDDKKALMIERNKIFVSTNNGKKWSKAKPLELNSDNYSVANPYLSPDGLRLYFVSDMPGGYGETDIYYCNRMGSGWSQPINLGPNVNTFNREKYPSLDATGNLYFASDGYQGYGGLDICVALNTNGNFAKAIPMKYPFNSFTDDYSILFIQDEKTGYISSNRSEGGQGDADIFYFDLISDASTSDLKTSEYTIGYKTKAIANKTENNTVNNTENTIINNTSNVMFSVNSPSNIPVQRRVRETFPIRNYVFFDLESTQIPSRYVLLTKDEVKNFKETNLEVFTPKKLTGRPSRQMIAYYNILNILGKRMGENPNSTITLVGSSEKGEADGKLMSESVKKYLVDVFGIKASRINIEGREKPKIPSEQPNGTNELIFLRQGDRRVSIESDAPAILMEFQSGQDVPLKPVEIVAVQEAPIDSYVTIYADGGAAPFTSWKLEVIDEKGKTQTFGPYFQNQVNIPGKSIMGTRTEGNYKFIMIGQTANVVNVKKDTTVHLVLWTPDVREEGMRFSVLFEYNDSKSIYIYEKYLTEVVTPKIPTNGKVIIHGHTDIIGDANYNLTLSTARANDVKTIIDKALAKLGRTDVKFEVRGYGEDDSLSPFDNKFPEERFYNRTVIIDIIPAK